MDVIVFWRELGVRAGLIWSGVSYSVFGIARDLFHWGLIFCVLLFLFRNRNKWSPKRTRPVIGGNVLANSTWPCTSYPGSFFSPWGKEPGYEDGDPVDSSGRGPEWLFLEVNTSSPVNIASLLPVGRSYCVVYICLCCQANKKEFPSFVYSEHFPSWCRSHSCRSLGETLVFVLLRSSDSGYFYVVLNDE